MNIHDAQQATEYKYSRKNIDAHIRQTLESNSTIMSLINAAVIYVNSYIDQDHYASKKARLVELRDTRDLYEVIMDIAVLLLPHNSNHGFANAVGEVTSRLKLNQQHSGVKTAGELVGLLAICGLYDIARNELDDSWDIVPIHTLDEKLYLFMAETKYMPPMIVPPKIISKNYDNAYLTIKESMINGSGNHHDGNVCLDSINIFNQVPLSLNTELLRTFSEQQPEEWSNPDHQKQWYKFVTDSYHVYKELVQAGNEFYLTHKVDKRGRTYAQGYHVSTQGNKFKKAIIDLAHKEVVSMTCP